MCIRCALVAAAQSLQTEDAEIILNTIIDLGYRGDLMLSALNDMTGNDTNPISEAIYRVSGNLTGGSDACLDILNRCDQVTKLLREPAAGSRDAVALVRSILHRRRLMEQAVAGETRH